MPAITQQKYETKKAIFQLLDRLLELHPEKGVSLAKGLAQHLASKMTLQELKIWRDRLQDAIQKAENA